MLNVHVHCTNPNTLLQPLINALGSGLGHVITTKRERKCFHWFWMTLLRCLDWTHGPVIWRRLFLDKVPKQKWQRQWALWGLIPSSAHQGKNDGAHQGENANMHDSVSFGPTSLNIRSMERKFEKKTMSICSSWLITHFASMKCNTKKDVFCREKKIFHLETLTSEGRS